MFKLNRLKFRVVIFVLSLLFYCIQIGYLTAGSADPFVRIMETQDRALLAYEKLLESEGFYRDEEGRPHFPDYYGGAFIDDAGKLNVLIASSSDDTFSQGVETESHLREMLDNSAVTFKSVEHSYNALYEAMNEVYDGISVAIEGYVDIERNAVFIGVEKDFFNSESNFLSSVVQNHLNQSNISIRIEPVKEIMPESELWSGDKLEPGGVTLSACGYYKGKPAILTSGHSGKLNTLYKYNNTNVGPCVFHRASGQYGDYSIVTVTNSAHKVTNKLFSKHGVAANPRRLTGFYSDPPNGTYLMKYGRMSGWADCRVEQTNVTIGGVKGLSKCFSASAETAAISQPGDSGGPYVRLMNGNWLYSGIHYGSSPATYGRYIYFTPYVLAYQNGFTVKTN